MIVILNYVIKKFSFAVIAVLSILPTSPFTWSLGSLEPYWHYVTFFIPIPEMITFTVPYTAAVLVWYGLRWLLRFTRYIG